jgi:hypothetical protein
LSETRRTARWGILALAIFLAHGVYRFSVHEPQALLWACNLAVLLVGFGLLLERPLLNGIGLCFFAIGTPTWIVDVLLGGELVPTAVLVHLGTPLISILGVRRLGMSRGVWWKAFLSWLAIQQASRLYPDASYNLNFVHAPYPRWDRTGLPYGAFFVIHVVLFAVVFFLVEHLGKKLARPEVNHA